MQQVLPCRTAFVTYSFLDHSDTLRQTLRILVLISFDMNQDVTKLFLGLTLTETERFLFLQPGYKLSESPLSV